MKKNLLICIDRDGTLIYDKKYHLGHQKDWKNKIRVLDGVVKGIKLLRKKFPEAKIHMMTNQAGVAIKEFPLLDEKRAANVCSYITNLLKKKGANLNRYALCGRADPSYVRSHPQFTFNKKFVGNFSCRKPNPGMINGFLKEEGWKKSNTSIYVIGDRLSDVETALRVNGSGILIPFKGELGEDAKFMKKKHKKAYMVENFLEAVELIIEKEK